VTSTTTPSAPGGLAFPTASWGRRLLALVVDWIACWLVVAAVAGWGTGGQRNLWVLVVYVVESAVFTTVLGGSFGKLLTRLRTVRVDGDPRPLDPVRSVARQIMVAVVIPPLIFKPDGRGMHDLAAGTASITLRTYRSLTTTTAA
jgi:uncharacterized RDD family membrane protein YckC